MTHTTVTEFFLNRNGEMKEEKSKQNKNDVARSKW